ncbi:MAG TPA: glycosyltransferase family 4 protein [Chloroflexota bacterium]
MAGPRDRYQLPLALHEGDLLQTLVSDVYWPADLWWFRRTLGALLPEHVASARYCPALGSRRVRLSATAFGAAAVSMLWRNRRVTRLKDESLSRLAARVARRTDAALLCYSYYASEAFQAGNQLPYRFLFQLHPHPYTVRAELLDELERTPGARASLMAEAELSLSDSELGELASEPERANGWMVASSYTAATLSQHGTPRDRIHVVPYGVDTSRFPARPVEVQKERPFTAVFVGSMVQRKGLSYLLDAIALLGSRQIRVVLCGRGQIDRRLLELYRHLDLDILVGLATTQLVRVLHESDVFVLPSIAEGFGHVILEAMAAGLPVITTERTCGPDVLEEGISGFIVPVRSAEAIAERLSWGMDNRKVLSAMGTSAANRARIFTWDRFRAQSRLAYEDMIVAAGNGNRMAK